MKNALIILFLIPVMGLAQGKVLKNLQNFDHSRWHFGFLLGYNYADFYLNTKDNTFEVDSLQSVVVQGKSGFNLGIISSLNVTPAVRLRFLPTLSFQERTLDYTFFELPDTSIFWTKQVSSVFLDFPLLMKMRTDRIGNFAAYIITGGRFGLDMQSNKDVKNSTALLKDQIVKITKPDYGIEVGGGFDFFLEYFKFGIELKLGLGLKNILIQEGTVFSNPIDKLRSKVWTVSMTFEG